MPNFAAAGERGFSSWVWPPSPFASLLKDVYRPGLSFADTSQALFREEWVSVLKAYAVQYHLSEYARELAFHADGVDDAAKAKAVAAASAVFAKEGVAPWDALGAMALLDAWDRRGFQDEDLPPPAASALINVWEQAEDAAWAATEFDGPQWRGALRLPPLEDNEG